MSYKIIRGFFGIKPGSEVLIKVRSGESVIGLGRSGSPHPS